LQVALTFPNNNIIQQLLFWFFLIISEAYNWSSDIS
jgi:hypothetical protein